MRLITMIAALLSALARILVNFISVFSSVDRHAGGVMVLRCDPTRHPGPCSPLPPCGYSSPLAYPFVPAALAFRRAFFC